MFTSYIHIVHFFLYRYINQSHATLFDSRFLSPSLGLYLALRCEETFYFVLFYFIYSCICYIGWQHKTESGEILLEQNLIVENNE